MQAYYKELEDSVFPILTEVPNLESGFPGAMQFGTIDRPGDFWANYAVVAKKYPKEHAEQERQTREKNKDSWKGLAIAIGTPLAAFIGLAYVAPALGAGAVSAESAGVFGGEIATGEALATGAGVESFAAYDAALAAGAAEGVGSTAGVFTGEAIAVESFAAYDAALAAGAAEGVGVVSTGASTGIFSTGGLMSSLGLGGLLKSAFGTATEIGAAGANTYLEREIQSMFGGGGSGPGAAGGYPVESEGGIFSSSLFLPILLIGVTLLGAFLLSRKGRK
jgi:hypothetical protein